MFFPTWYLCVSVRLGDLYVKKDFTLDPNAEVAETQRASEQENDPYSLSRHERKTDLGKTTSTPNFNWPAQPPRLTQTVPSRPGPGRLR